MTRLNRRDFFRLGAAGLAWGAAGALPNVPLLRNPLFRSALYAGGCDLTPSAKKLLVIFLRGGNDGVNTVIPYGDSSYNLTSRPTLFIPPDQAIDLNGFAALHPSLAKIHEVYLAGDLAVVHRVGYAGQSRSHFSSQKFWENADPGDLALEEGWVNRLIAADPTLADHALPGATVSYQNQLLFRGERVLAHIRDLATYEFGSDPAAIKLLGALPASPGESGSGLLGVFSQPDDGTAQDPTVRGTGIALGRNIDHLVCRGIDPDAYVPFGGATYPDASAPEEFSGSTAFNFFRQLKQSAQLLKESDVRVVGVEVNGFDTHSNQGTQDGWHPNLLNMLGHGVRSLWLDLQGPTNIWNDTVVLTLTEFGRTSEENASNGTDHGESSVVFVAGGAVNGSTFNCDATTWADGDMFSTPNGRYVTHATDYRGVLAEIIDLHFGLAADLDTIIPGWSGLSGSPFTPLGLL